MAISSICFLSFPTPPSGSKPPSLPPSKTAANNVVWPINKSERSSLKERSFQGLLTCAIMFSDVGIFESNQISAIAAQEDHHQVHELVIAESNMAKWSEKRKCPSWQLNSLETIVPENLPRPHFRRRWEEVGDTSGGGRATSEDAKVRTSSIIRISSSCFTM